MRVEEAGPRTRQALARFFGAKFRSAALYRIYERTGNPAALGTVYGEGPNAPLRSIGGKGTAVGAALGTIAVIIKQEILLAIVGGIFVIETLSVIIQVVSFKCRGKRVFKMAPIHHHFELKGWNEAKIVVRFWIVSVILGLIAITTLKLR